MGLGTNPPPLLAIYTFNDASTADVRDVNSNTYLEFDDSNDALTNAGKTQGDIVGIELLEGITRLLQFVYTNLPFVPEVFFLFHIKYKCMSKTMD